MRFIVSSVGEEIGRRLKEVRKRQEYTQEELAAECGLSVDTIRKIENGRFSRLDLNTYSALSRVLGAETKWFQIEQEGRMPKLTVARPTTDAEFMMIQNNEERMYGDEALPAGMLRSWIEAYPDGAMSLYDGDKIVGGFGMWPATKAWFEQFERGEISEDSLGVDVMTTALTEVDGPSYWYFGGILVLPEYQGGWAASILLRRSMAMWARALGDDIAQKHEVVAMAISTAGERLLRATKFRLVRPAVNGSHPIYRSTLTTEKLLEIAAEV